MKKQHMIKTGADIKRLRELSGITQKELAKRCFCSREYISSLERGERDLKKANEEIRKWLNLEYEIITKKIEIKRCFKKICKEKRKKGLIFILKRIINKLFRVKLPFK